MRSRAAASVAAGVLLAAAAGLWLARSAPPPAADPSAGSEDAFATGLHRRELVSGSPPLRWTRQRARLRFERLRPGAAQLGVSLAGHRQPVRVVAGGVVLGLLLPGEREARFPLRLREGSLEVELLSDGFEVGDGRQLGAQLRRVELVPAEGGDPAKLAALLVAPAAAFGLVALSGGAAVALLASLLGAGLPLALLWPSGACYSPWAPRLSAVLVLGALLAWLFGAWRERRDAGSGLAAGVALLGAWVVQVVLGAAPVMVVSDVVFHAHKLEEVAAGQLFPVSVTQHAVPFRIPYPAVFYALLAPLYRAGLDSVELVRWGAGLSAALAAAGLFLGLRRGGIALAALAALLLQLEPGSFDVHSFGNLSNVFAQSMTILALAWWLGGARVQAVGVGMMALAAASHLSGFIVLGVWLGALLLVERGEDRRRAAAALGLGLGLALAYYGAWLPLILEQLPRLLEGGGQGRGASQGALGVLRLQLLGAVGQWGLPAIALAAVGAPRSRAERLDRALIATFAAGAGLGLLALVSPVEVRYLYFLGPPVAICAARGVLRLRARGPLPFGLALLALLLQLWLALRGFEEALFVRYRY
jgi:hypothetical protein